MEKITSTAHKRSSFFNLFLCHIIIILGYLIIRTVFLFFGLQLHLTAQGISLSLIPFFFGTVYLLKKSKKKNLSFYATGILFPSVFEKLTLYFIGAYLCGVSPFRVKDVLRAVGRIEPYATSFTRMPMRYVINLLFFNETYIICGVSFSILCVLILYFLQKRKKNICEINC